MAEPSNWAMERAGMLLWGYVPEEGGSGLNPKLLQQWAKIAAALDAARQKGIEEAARIADGARELVELRGEIGFVAAYRFAADLAKDIADDIRSLATKEATDG